MKATAVYCKYCHQRLFDITPETRGRIEIKCSRCRKVVGITIWKEAGSRSGVSELLQEKKIT